MTNSGYSQINKHRKFCSDDVIKCVSYLSCISADTTFVVLTILYIYIYMTIFGLIPII